MQFGEGGTFPRHFLCLLWPAWWDLLLCWQQTPIAQQGRSPACQGWQGPAAAQGHGQGHSWQTWILAPLYCCCILLFPRLISVVEFHCPISGFGYAPNVHNLLILVFLFWQISSTHEQWLHSCFLVPSCTPFLSELPAKSLDLAAINLTELVNGMLSTALRGKGTQLGRSQLPAQQSRRKGTTSAGRRSCKHVLSARRLACRSVLPLCIYHADGCLPQRTWKLVWVYI